jgi:hypothetical protein
MAHPKSPFGKAFLDLLTFPQISTPKGLALAPLANDRCTRRYGA